MIKKKVPKNKLIILFIILFFLFIFTPIPYYQSEAICKMGQTCPQAGWYWGKSILQLIKYSLNNTSETESIKVEKKNCGGFAANLPQNQCPKGFYCKLDGNYPDASGTCIKK